MKLVHSTDDPKPKKYRARSKKEAEPIICPQCGGALFVEIISSPLRRGRRRLKRSGERYLACQSCQLRGKTIICD